MKKQVFISKFHDIKLELLELKEPNYGRMVWDFCLLFKGTRIDNKYINQNSYFLSGFDQLELDSLEGKYIFLPTEKSLLLMEVAKKKFYEMPGPTHTRKGRFLSNYFTETQLVIHRPHEITIYNHITHNSINLSFPNDEYQILASTYKNKKFFIRYKDLTNYLTHTNEYDFKSMSLI